ncbi:alpha/beta hydrolase [Marmoricola endophyticus]|uniref:Alpha/beta hydrolase n=1 Tax=Marmoricola endophyticus TaxID=2040280 RepID=A0A917F6P7_9ACTN|nr:alpha/beta fold hydrolase [Marmoricola endophyticus]GGF54294.1 alpha/beta hydrolase [Marmoricola endophyticus]
MSEIARSEELRAPQPAGPELCYQTFGDPEDEPLLLVMGLGGPMTWWDTAICERFVRAGFFVVRYDNRETGRSERGEGRVTKAQLVRAFLGLPTRAPYSIGDLAEDAFGLMDHLGWSSAHVCGVSMGGMIVQSMALARPERVRSMTSIMSTTGRRTVGWQDPTLLPALLAPRQRDRASYIDASVGLWQRIGSPAYRRPDDVVRAQAAETWDRTISAAGVLRQMLAVLTQPDRTRALHDLDVPTLVIHGDADRMVHVSGGRATAAAVPGAELLVVRGMGHDTPEPLHGLIVDGVRRTADRTS